MYKFLAVTATIALAAVLTAPASAAPIYNFTSFDGSGDNAGGTTVNGINNNGAVVGFSSNAAGTVLTNFVRAADGTFTVLNIAGDPVAMANGINTMSTVAGASNGAAFLLTGPFFSMLPAVNGNTTSETAFGLNDGGLGGLVVGQYVDGATGTTPGFLFRNGAFTILSPVANAFVTNAQGVNNSGLVAGFYSTDGAHQHGFLYNAGTGTYTLLNDPTVPNLLLTQFLGINDNGLAVGYYQTNDGSQHGFLYNTSTHSYNFLDDPSAALSGVSITQITGVNDAGELTGFYVDAASGLQRGFIATPTPEPATLGLMLGGLLLLIGSRSRSHRG
jgi:probable HAF family extracellular repeat protein